MVEMVERLGTLGPRAKAALDDRERTRATRSSTRGGGMNRCRLAAEGGADVAAVEGARARERRRRSREV